MVVPAAASVLDNITFSDCWFEGNYPDNTHYEVFLDGSNVPSHCGVNIIRPYFARTVSGAKSIRVLGSIIFSFIDVIPNFDLSFPILIQGTTCLGEISLNRLYEGGYYSSYVSDANNRAHNLKSYANTAWTPVGTNITDTGSAGYTGSYCKNGNVVTGSIRVLSGSGNTSATAGSSYFAAPSEFPCVSPGNCVASTNATANLGVGNVLTTSRIQVPSWTTQTDVYITFWYYSAWLA
jgi:hypothetical protein